MENVGIIGLSLILINAYFSYLGLYRPGYLERYSFDVGSIISGKDYKRLLTSGFLHVSWMHFIFNMLTLYFFSYGLESGAGAINFLIIYFGSLVGGNLFALFIHRNKYDYTAVGASGAISGIVFASVALFPGLSISIFFLPIYIPGWAYGLLFVLISIYGIRSQSDNVGHEAHLGGGLIGLAIATFMYPAAFTYNTLPILLIVVPSIIFIYLLISKPQLSIKSQFSLKEERYYSREDLYRVKKREKEKELDRLLDKISKKGIDSLTNKEKERLNQLSQEV